MSYAHPEVLVSTDWVAEHLNDPNVRLIEVNEDVLLYETGHIPGAVKVDWHTDLQREDVRDFIDEQGFAELMRRLGVTRDTTVVFYGDKNNWWAAYAFWFWAYNGHTNAKLMNGGRQKWVAENRELTTEVPAYPATEYAVPYRDESIRAYRDDVLKHIIRVKDGKGALVDVRSPDEYSGKLTHMAAYPQEGALRAGHIPGARSIPWAKAANEDGTFKSYEELKALYEGEGVTSDKDIIAYCRIAERSSHSWFVLRYLLGYPRVANYDGSWTEWGNIVGMPIEK
ncbi:thiosulfate/3-mercaptopyruvate sulfurtransferase [Deinobacterium chartae]|uniref:Sulfurtransferase n=1 Tax=Deinobacterium chartae TaxID=521158 RepID=A0A841I4M0_9DEIO|nr:sulfurtransferase [Deinobacterium chartae]MBB6098922.1 thiosulfate/3-mercaptopyruvate sulfurtransferase [Deinobacterium chartae]